jgi:membrane protease YdiL (CAAX protease family)
MATGALRAGDDAAGNEPVSVGWTLREAAWVFATWIAVSVLVGMVVGGPPHNMVQRALLLFAPSFALGVLTLLGAGTRGQDGAKRLMGQERPSIRDVGAGLVYGIVGVVVLTFGVGFLLRALVDMLNLRVPPVQQELRQLAAGSAAPLAIVVIVAIAPIAEELFFRGMLFQAFERRLGVWPSAVLSAAIFGAVHVEWIVFVVTFLFGIHLALIFRRRGTIVTPIVAHMLFNGLGVLAIRAGVG